MHPVVIMAYDKSPAINKAVAALEEAGMEVVVLNTRTAKLVQFLGALAGEENLDDDEPAEPAEDETKETPPEEEPKDAAAQPEPEADPEAEVKESLFINLNGEQVTVKLVEGLNGVRLHTPECIRKNGKFTVSLNESLFSFWEDSTVMVDVYKTENAVHRVKLDEVFDSDTLFLEISPELYASL